MLALTVSAVGLALGPGLAPRAPPSGRAAQPVLSGAASQLEVDVAVIGGGPAGYAMAALLGGRHGHSVALVDPKPSSTWPNNYGEWRIEWEELSRQLQMPELLERCVAREYAITDCYFGGSWDMPNEQRTRLEREYVQVDRRALKKVLQEKLSSAPDTTVIEASLRARTIAPNVFDQNLAHDAAGSELTLSNGESLRAKLVVDASGFESKLVRREPISAAGYWKELPPGYQIAYGFNAVCEPRADGGCGHAPYDPEAMTLFDYRTDHIAASGDAAWLEDATSRPSFMYVMPQQQREDGAWEVFFEETSLVGRDERRLEFAELKKRAERRLEHLGIKVRAGSVNEEEFCYIPMGGSLPDATQRLVAVGGAAATVHPSTGYQLCRMLASATPLAATLSAELGKGGLFDPDAAAAAAYQSLWPQTLRLQRDFQVFGGEFLGIQRVDYLRGFFSAFFKLDTMVWGGFLAGWPGLPGNEFHDRWDKRLKFGISLFVNFPPPVAFALMYYAVKFSLEFGPGLLRSFLSPLFGDDSPLELREQRKFLEGVYMSGDMAAKREALAMLSRGAEGSEPSPQVAELVSEEA